MTVVRAALPQHWVVREISPDYGLDLHIETFIEVPENEAVWDALGEHVFAQVKNVDGVTITKITPHTGRESKPIELLPAETAVDLDSMEVVSYSLETDEIETVRQMGSAVPVLLLVVDKKTTTTYYICLNDWIAKVLPVVCPGWRDQATVTVHIPRANVLSSDGKGWNYLSLLAKRPKFYGAFAEFGKYQEEMRWAESSVRVFEDFGAGVPDLSREVAQYKQLFSFYRDELVDLDIWPTDERRSLDIFYMLADDLKKVQAALDEVPDDWTDPENRHDSYRHRMQYAMTLAQTFFSSLAATPQSYGLLTRNWNLPTQLGQHVRAIHGDLT